MGGCRLRLELAAQQRVHDEVDTAPSSLGLKWLERRIPSCVKPAFSATRLEAGFCSSARSWSRSIPRSCSAQWAAELQRPRAHAVATRFGRNPVADLRDPVVGLVSSSRRSSRPASAVDDDREVRRRAARPALAGALDVVAGVVLRVREGDDVQELRDRAVVAGCSDGLDILLARPTVGGSPRRRSAPARAAPQSLSYDMQPV